MKLVIDTNRIIAALVKDSFSREVILNSNYEFITPDFTLEEINKYKQDILEKAGLDEYSFDVLMALIQSNIEIIPISEYKKFLQEAEIPLKERDIKDAPLVAVALAKKAEGIWSDDRDLETQQKIKIYKTKDLMP